MSERRPRLHVMPRKRASALSIFLICIAFAIQPSRATERPSRIVSVNLCTDQLLFDLAPRKSIAALSKLAADPQLSGIAAEVGAIPTVATNAEDILSHDPDLIIAGDFTAPATLDVLRRLGKRVVIVPLARNFDDLRAGIRIVAAAIGDDGRGEAIIRDFNGRLATARSLIPSQPTALGLQANGLVSGAGDLFDAILIAAGYRNLARDLALGPGSRIDLEQLVSTPPDLLVFANAPSEYRSVVADNLRHPALVHVTRSGASITLPMPLWLCATPRVADAVELLSSLKSTRFAHVKDSQ